MSRYLGLFFVVFLGWTTLQADPHQLLRYANHLLGSREYRAAVYEFKRFIFFHPDDQSVFEAYRGLGKSFRALGEWVRAVNAYQSALVLTPDDETYGQISFELAQTYLEAGRTDEAMLEFDRIMIQSSSSRDVFRKAMFFKFIASVSRYHWKAGQDALTMFLHSAKNPSLAPEGAAIDSMLVVAQRQTLVSAETAIWLSTFVPGLGQMYIGDLRNGVNALGLNAVLAYVTFDLVAQKQYIEGTLFFSSIFLRYYLGNRYRAGLLAEEENARRKSEMARKILDRSLNLVPD